MGRVDWHRDDRSMSWWTRLYVAGMRWARDKKAFEGEENTRRNALQRQESGDARPTRWTRRRLRLERRDRDGMTVWVARPRRGAVRRTVVYLHGGGYVHPLTPDYWRLVRALATDSTEVVVPFYPLAPGATIDDALPKLTDLAAEACARGPVVLMGDSAGGALTLVLARLLTDAGQAPAGAVMLCPWLDAELSDDSVKDLESTDPMLAESGLRAAGRWWAGDRGPDDPLVSPIELSLEGLPPLDVFIGDRDILRPAVDRLAEKARATAGADLTVHETPAMFHVWMTRAIPEGRRTRRELQRLLSDRTSRAAG